MTTRPQHTAIIVYPPIVRCFACWIRQTLPEKRRVQVVEEEPLDEFTPTAHSDLLEDAAKMVLDGVLGDKECLGDTRRREATHDELHEFFFAGAQAVGSHAAGQQLFGLRGFYYDYRLRTLLRGRLGQRTVERQPAPRACSRA